MNYSLVKKISDIFDSKFECFHTSLYIALRLKEIFINYKWPRPSSPLKPRSLL